MSTYSEDTKEFIEAYDINKCAINPNDVLVIIDSGTSMYEVKPYNYKTLELGIGGTIYDNDSCIQQLIDNVHKINNAKFIITPEIAANINTFNVWVSTKPCVVNMTSKYMLFEGDDINTYCSFINKVIEHNKILCSNFYNDIDTLADNTSSKKLYDRQIGEVRGLAQEFINQKIAFITSEGNIPEIKEHFKQSSPNVTVISSFEQLEKYLKEAEVQGKFCQNLVKNKMHANLGFRFL